jgi:type IV pilus assembly protein PilC
VSYPLVILCTAVAVVAFMLAVIVPMFEQVYARMGGELPALTRWIIALSKSFPAYAGMTVGSGIAAYIVLYTNRNRKEVQRWTSECLLHLPVAGTIIRKNYQAQFCKLLYLLASSGVPLLTGVGMLADVIGFYPYRESFGVICRGLEQGEAFSSGIAKFPGLYGNSPPSYAWARKPTAYPRCSGARATPSPKNSNTGSSAWGRCSNRR